MRKTKTLALCSLVTCAALAAPTVAAQESQGWRFSGSLNLFLPKATGTSTFPPSGGSSSTSVDIGPILGLETTFMGSFQAQKGRWGLFADVVYLDLGAQRSGSRDLRLGRADLPAGASASLDYGLKGWSSTVAGTYSLAADSRHTVEAIGGARLLDIQSRLEWSTSGNIGSIALADRAGTRESELRNWDAIVGLKGRYVLPGSGKWFVPWYLDVGAGDSRLTTQAVGGLGYAFSWGDIVGSWRYLGYEMKSGSALQDLRFSGPMASAVFHW